MEDQTAGCGLWLPEGKEIMFGMESENVVAYGRLSSPAHDA